TRESALCRAGRRPVAKDRRCPQTLRASPQGATWRDPHSPGRGRLPLAFGASGRRSRSISASDEVGNGIAGGPRVRSPHGRALHRGQPRLSNIAKGPGATRSAGRQCASRRDRAELRVQALALALQRDKASKEQAIRILEGARESLSPNDTFLLAQTYLAVGKTGQVRLVMSELLRKADNVPLYVNFFTRWLIRQGSAS